jgi:hypothetical protein
MSIHCIGKLTARSAKAMTNSARQPHAGNAATLTASFFLIFFYPLMGLLWHHDYPAFSGEVLLIMLGMAVMSVLLALVLRPVRTSVLNLVIATLLTVSFTVNFNPLFLGILSILAGTLFAAFALGRHLPASLLVVLPALIIGAYLDERMDRTGSSPNLASATAAHARGPLVHILVDGFIGPDGLPDAEESDNLRAELLSFFERNGFRLHTRAYSHYASTVDSMTRAMNFRNDDANLFRQTTQLREPLAVTENAWFKALRDIGYPVIVYQSEGVDFCSTGDTSVKRCNTFPIPNLKTIHDGIDVVHRRALILLRTLLRQSHIVNEQLMRYVPKYGVSNYDERMLAGLKRDLSEMPGNAYFAHIILPHHPLVYRPDCSLDYDKEPWKHFTVFDGVIGNSEETQRIRYKRYAANAKCALNELDSLLSTLRSARLYDDATIIIHGDHGGPLFRFGPFTVSHSQLTLRDLRETFSILYAVKLPGGQFELDNETTSLNVLMARTLLEISGKSPEALGISVLAEPQPFIYLTDTVPLTRVDVDIFNE